MDRLPTLIIRTCLSKLACKKQDVRLSFSARYGISLSLRGRIVKFDYYGPLQHAEFAHVVG